MYDKPPYTQSPAARKFGSPSIKHETSSTLDTLVAETSDEEMQEDLHQVTPSNPTRYLQQQKSAHGKVAYVVFAGDQLGVFYNWTAASHAIAGVADANKIYKGYCSHEAAHLAWEAFVKTGHLPTDVAMTLGSKPYPTPPAISAPPLPAPPSTPQRGHHTSASSFVPSSPTLTQSPRTRNRLNTIQPTASPSTPRTPTLAQQRNAAARVIALEEAFRADQEDFWVVFTGSAPGVHQGREAGESAFGQLTDPLFVRTSAREHANQIFVDGYMKLLVERSGSS